MSEVVGTVRALRRFPVKSMQGELLQTAAVGPQGVVGDRLLAVVDRVSGQLVAGKTPVLGPRLLACTATLAAEPESAQPVPPIVIQLPDGTCVHSDARDADEALSSYLGHPVRLASACPPESALLALRRDLLEAAGHGRHVDELTLRDLLPVSVVTTSTLERLAAARPETSFDARRFRMNVAVTTHGDGFLENDWPGHELRLGPDVGLAVAFPVPRCAITTMAQEDLPRDPAVLRTVARENTRSVAGRSYPCVGVYATVAAAGHVSTGDPVTLG